MVHSVDIDGCRYEQAHKNLNLSFGDSPAQVRISANLIATLY